MSQFGLGFIANHCYLITSKTFFNFQDNISTFLWCPQHSEGFVQRWQKYICLGQPLPSSQWHRYFISAPDTVWHHFFLKAQSVSMTSKHILIFAVLYAGHFAWSWPKLYFWLPLRTWQPFLCCLVSFTYRRSSGISYLSKKVEDFNDNELSEHFLLTEFKYIYVLQSIHFLMFLEKSVNTSLQNFKGQKMTGSKMTL